MLFGTIQPNQFHEANAGSEGAGAETLSTAATSTSEPAATESETIPKAEYEKKVAELNKALHEARQKNQSLNDKAQRFDQVAQIYTQFQQNPSVENAERVMGLAPGTLSKGMTKAEKQETDTSEMTDEAKDVISRVEKMFADKESKLKSEIDALKQKQAEQEVKSLNNQYKTYFDQTMKEHFSKEPLPIQQNVARNLHTLVALQKMSFEDAVKQIKDELAEIRGGAKKETIAEAKKVAEQHKKNQPSPEPAGAKAEEKGPKKYTKSSLSEAQKEFRKNLAGYFQKTREQATT